MQPGSSAYATPLSVDEDSRVQPCNTAVSLPWWEEFVLNSNRYEDDGEHFFGLRLAAQGMNFTGLQTPSFEIRTEKNQPYIVSVPTGTQVPLAPSHCEGRNPMLHPLCNRITQWEV